MEIRRCFNTEGQCKPKLHYMVNLDRRLAQIKKQYVDMGKYFIINRGRQYGKTTLLRALAEYLKDSYVVLAMDFQKMSSANFESERTFVLSFIEYMEVLFEDEKTFMENVDSEVFKKLLSIKDDERIVMDSLFMSLSRLCETAKKPIVLMIDEVDSATNNQVFLDFLAMLRGYYLDRDKKAIFQSVILAGVYDIKNLKLKIRPEKEHKFNSPWNISAEFDIEMSFSINEIAEMLSKYEEDNKTSMDLHEISKEIYQNTSGYPYLVSRICKLLDEKVPMLERFQSAETVWTKEGILEAIKILLNESTPLFESMMRQLDEYPNMKQMLHAILFQGKRISYNANNSVIQLAAMFGYIVNKNGSIQVANRIFETRLYNFFLSEEELTNAIYDEAQGSKSQFLINGKLNMDFVLEKFVIHFTDIYGENNEKFIEEYGRKFFLLYLKPIINGTGNYYIEAQTRDARRTDVIVDYMGEQFIVELKIWRGNEYNERGETQVADYLEYYHLEKGYMISFHFNKKKEIGVRKIKVGDKEVIEAVV